MDLDGGAASLPAPLPGSCRQATRLLQQRVLRGGLVLLPRLLPMGNAPVLPERPSTQPDETAHEEAANEPTAARAQAEPQADASPLPAASAREGTATGSRPRAAPPPVAGAALLAAAAQVLALAVRGLVVRGGPEEPGPPGEDVFAWLGDDDVLRIFSTLLPADRVACACVSRRFNALLRRPEAWAVIDVSASDNVDALRGLLDDQKLIRASVRAQALRVLNTEGKAAHVSATAVSVVLSGTRTDAPGPAGALLESLTVFSLAPLHDTDALSFSRFVGAESDIKRFFMLQHLEMVSAACPRLRSAAVGVIAEVREGVRALRALDALPRDGVKALVLCLPMLDSPAVRADVDAFAEALATNSSLHALAVARDGQHPLLPDEGPARRWDADREGLDTWSAEFADEPHRGDDRSGLAQYVATRLADALRRNTTLTALDLSTNGIGDQGTMALCDALMEAGGRSRLRQLFLINTGLRTSGAIELGKLVASPTSPLRKLVVDDNYLGNGAIVVLVSSLRSEGCRLRVLSARFMNAAMAPPEPLLSYVAHALLANRSLEVLDIGRNGNFGKNTVNDMQQLADALRVNTTLTTLNMAWVELEGEVEVLLEALPENNTLRNLSLSHAPSLSPLAVLFGRRNVGTPPLPLATQRLGRRLVTAVLARNTSLRRLELKGVLPTLLGGDAAALAAGLGRNGSLTALDLDVGAGGLGRGAGAALGAALSAPRCALRSLAMSCQGKLRGGDLAVLSRGLAANASLTTLLMNFCGVCPSGGAALAAAIATNSTLRDVQLLGNSIGDTGARALAHALRVNNTLNVLMLLFPPDLDPTWTRVEQMRRADASSDVRDRARLILGQVGIESNAMPPWMPNDIGADAAAELRAAATRRRVLLEPRVRAPDA